MRVETFNRPLAIAAIVAAIDLTGCGGGGISVTSVNPSSPSYSSLQLAVGTANLYGDGHIGLNVVSTFRQTNGTSATGVNSPRITGPFEILAPPVPSYGELNSGFPDPYTTVFNGGPSWREQHGGTISSTPQTVAPGTPSCDGPGPFPPGRSFVVCPHGLAPNTTTFGQSGGVFAMGFQPANAVAATAQGYSYQPYPQPFYANNLVKHNPRSSYQFIPWGGPPAFDPDGDGMGTRDGLIIQGTDSFGDPYFLGVGEGVTAFDGVKIRGGAYTLTVAISTIGNGGAVSTSSVSKSASLDPGLVLPTLRAPVFTPDGMGGGVVTTSLPAGVTEAYVQIVDYGPGGGPNDGAAATPANCQQARGTSFAPVYYTIEVSARGRVTYRLPDTDGPNLATSGGKSNLKPSPSICTAKQNESIVGKGTKADDIVVQMIGFNYPVYAAAHGLIEATTPENPPITGLGGQADVTVSLPMEQDDGSTSQSPVTSLRHAAFVRTIRS
jgi:hypothetical protein